MPSSSGRTPTRVEVLGSLAAVEAWTEITAGRHVEVAHTDDPTVFPQGDGDLAIAFVAPDEACALATSIAARQAGQRPSIALLIGPPDAADALSEFARMLAQAKREWEQAFDAIVDPVAILAPDGCVRRANRALTQRVARPFERVIGEHYLQLFGCPTLTPDPIAAALQGGTSVMRESGFASLDGVFQLTLSPLRSTAGDHGVVVILKDVTDLKDQQQRLEVVHRLSDVGRLAGGVAHEISTPLASIALRAESLLRHAQDPQLVALEAFKDFPRYLKTIEEETFRCKRIIGALLEFSRPRRPEVLASDINVLAERAASLVGDQMKAKQVSVKLNLAAQLPYIAVDAAQIREALLALLLNAMDACTRGGVVTVETEALPAGRIRLVVADNGVGIAPENLDKVMTPFFTTKPVGQATGLGLPICQGIVSAHGGEIDIRSAVGQGTSVTIVLPPQPPQGGSDNPKAIASAGR